MEKFKSSELESALEVTVKPKLNVSAEEWHVIVLPLILEAIKEGEEEVAARKEGERVAKEFSEKLSALFRGEASGKEAADGFFAPFSGKYPLT